MSSLATSMAMTRLLALAMAKAFTSPAAVSMFGTRSTLPPVACSSARTWSGGNDLRHQDDVRPALQHRGEVLAAAGFERIDAHRGDRARPAPCRRKHCSDSALARGRNSGGVKSSSSRMMTSAPERAAAGVRRRVGARNEQPGAARVHHRQVRPISAFSAAIR